MVAWGINAVRLPLNEDCWLGINGVDPAYGGANYRTAITSYVHQLIDAGIVPIVELSGSAPGDELAGSDQIGQQPMPDADHSIDFWTDVASTFKNDGNVVFDLFNEPFPDGNQDTVAAWTCWRDGGAACPGLGYTAVGMQQLVDTVRATGAPNLILLGGVQYSRINAQWLNYEPSDSLQNLAASWHLYPNSYCNTQTCWDAQFQPFLSQAAAVATEIGQGPSQPGPCGVDFLDSVMLWLDAHNEGYLAWTWDAWGDCFSLIGNWGNASPAYAPTTPYGRTYHDHLLGIPQPPSNVVAAAGSSTAAVSWQPPTDEGTSTISSYQVTPHDLTTGNDGATVTVAGTSTMVPVSNGDSYTFTVTATNDAGTSAPSSASAAVSPQAGLPAPAAATGTASATTSTTVSTGNDPAVTGGTSTQVTVPAGTSGGAVTIAQSGTSEAAPTGYTFGGVQIDISAPPASQANPLTLVFTTAIPSGYPPPPDPSALTATYVYRAEGTGQSQPIPKCIGAVSVVDPEPACVQSKQYVTVGGSTFVQVTVIAETASHWNSARPTPRVVSVSSIGYSPVSTIAQQGGLVTWTFTGTKQHSVTDSAGLGSGGKPLFDSGAKTSGSYTFQFPAAGTYAYKSTVKGDSLTGTVAIAPLVSHSGSSYTVIWAAGQMTGYQFNVKYRFKPANSSKWGSWTAWLNATPNPDATFVPPKSGGTYDFQATLRNSGTGRLSGNSPDTFVTVP
jgi:plastocyanin